jgi:hypothetical protein
MAAVYIRVLTKICILSQQRGCLSAFLNVEADVESVKLQRRPGDLRVRQGISEKLAAISDDPLINLAKSRPPSEHRFCR